MEDEVVVIDTPDAAETRPQAQTNQYSDIPVNIDSEVHNNSVSWMAS